MTSRETLVARYNPSENTVDVSNHQGGRLNSTDATCLSRMLSELIDEMVSRGYDPESIVLYMNKGIAPPRGTDRTIGYVFRPH